MNYTPDVEAMIDSYSSKQIERSTTIDDRYAELWREIRQYLLNGGKRMRPRLVLMAYEAYGGKNIDSAIAIAAAWEMLHASLLVHDDIIDRDLVRVPLTLTREN
jgi:geranylgeranyl diphosphate synthase type II